MGEGRDEGWREREKGLGKKLRGRVRERRVRKRDKGNRGVDHRPAIDYIVSIRNPRREEVVK